MERVGRIRPADEPADASAAIQVEIHQQSAEKVHLDGIHQTGQFGRRHSDARLGKEHGQRSAPKVANLEQWLKDNASFEVIKPNTLTKPKWARQVPSLPRQTKPLSSSKKPADPVPTTKSKSQVVKDFYVLPLPKDSPIPLALATLSSGTKCKFSFLLLLPV